MATGWTWEDVDRLTLPRYEALLKYWKRFPPIHIMIAGYFGLGKDEPEPVSDAASFADFFTAMTGEMPPL